MKQMKNAAPVADRHFRRQAMIKLDPSITDPKRMARRIAQLHDRIEQLEREKADCKEIRRKLDVIAAILRDL
jgi:hypothetical protein